MVPGPSTHGADDVASCPLPVRRAVSCILENGHSGEHDCGDNRWTDDSAYAILQAAYSHEAPESDRG